MGKCRIGWGCMSRRYFVREIAQDVKGCIGALLWIYAVIMLLCNPLFNIQNLLPLCTLLSYSVLRARPDPYHHS